MSIDYDSPLCGAPMKSGKTCSRQAGWGTPYDRGRCRQHGGTSRNQQVATARHTIAAMAEESDADPHQLLLRLIRLAWGAISYCREKLDQLDEDHLLDLGSDDKGKPYVVGTEYAMWTKLYGEERDRAADLAELAITAGIAEKQIEIEQEKGRLMAVAIRTILDGLGLTKAQQAKAGPLVRQTLLALDAG